MPAPQSLEENMEGYVKELEEEAEKLQIRQTEKETMVKSLEDECTEAEKMRAKCLETREKVQALLNEKLELNKKKDELDTECARICEGRHRYHEPPTTATVDDDGEWVLVTLIDGYQVEFTATDAGKVLLCALHRQGKKCAKWTWKKAKRVGEVIMTEEDHQEGSQPAQQ